MSKNLFIIDDHYWFRSGVADCITGKSDWKVAGEAGTVEEAELLIENLSKNTIPHSEKDIYVALVDISFKDSEKKKSCDYGFDIVQQFRKKCPFVKAIMLSSYETSGFIQKSLSPETGALGYVSKSADDEILLEALEAVSDGKTYVQPDLVSDLLNLKDLLSNLTKKEREVADNITVSNTNKDIAEKMNISVFTVENYMTRLYDKTGTNSRPELLKKLGRL